jgi:hypothetical protein
MCVEAHNASSYPAWSLGVWVHGGFRPCRMLLEQLQTATQNKAVSLLMRTFKLFMAILRCTDLLTEHHYTVQRVW